MSIYVDELIHRGLNYRGTKVKSCHMMTDGNLIELHEMAIKLQMRRWFQDHPTHPHYDLMAGKRATAIEFGAIPVTGKEMVIKCSLHFTEGRRKEEQVINSAEDLYQ